MEKGKGMPQITSSLAIGKSADLVAVAVAVPQIAYGIASLDKVARLQICLHQTTQILG